MGGAVLAIVGGIVAPGLGAQFPAAPASYSVTQLAGMFGVPVTVEIYGGGSEAVLGHLNGGRLKPAASTIRSPMTATGFGQG